MLTTEGIYRFGCDTPILGKLLFEHCAQAKKSFNTQVYTTVETGDISFSLYCADSFPSKLSTSAKPPLEGV